MSDLAFERTIPDNPMMCKNYDCSTDTRYGMHEDYDYYAHCKTRLRNEGLYLINQVGIDLKYVSKVPWISCCNTTGATIISSN